MNKKWNVLGRFIPSNNLEANNSILKDLVNQILIQRKIEDIEGFLNPRLIDGDFFDEMVKLFGDELSKAVKLILDTITKGQSIVIHGDYDVDGASSTGILWETLYYHLGYKNSHPFIPHRVQHGYGLTNSSVDEVANLLTEKGQEPGLLITVDCGVTAQSSVEYAKSKGFKVIITDHHTLPESNDNLPNADAILHTYELCGAGIAWVLARSLDQANQDITKGVDLVALASLSDIQTLTGFNRSLVKYGLSLLSKTDRVGLQLLYKLVQIHGKELGPYEVGWVIGPRLNAVGRLEHALDALRILVVKHPQQALDIATRLNDLNTKRQEMTQVAVQQAINLVDQTWPGDQPIIVSSPEWHEGIIGLIASKLAEKYNVPSMVISEGETIAKGSARSVSGVNIMDILNEGRELMESVGGHEMAGGFSLKKEKIQDLQSKIQQIKISQRWDLSSAQELKIDLEVEPSLINWSVYESIQQLEPFGVGNPKPVFLIRHLGVRDSRTVGKNNDHLKLKFSDGIEGVAFGFGQMGSEISVGKKLDVVFNLDKNDWMGNQRVELKIKDMKISEG